MTQEYRKDGWPLCPHCGQDELWCRQIPASVQGALRCYQCGWEGTVPVASTAHTELDVGPDIPGGGAC